MRRYRLTLAEMSGIEVESWTVTRDGNDQDADHQLDRETSGLGRDIEYAMEQADKANPGSATR